MGDFVVRIQRYRVPRSNEQDNVGEDVLEIFFLISVHEHCVGLSIQIRRIVKPRRVIKCHCDGGGCRLAGTDDFDSLDNLWETSTGWLACET